MKLIINTFKYPLFDPANCINFTFYSRVKDFSEKKSFMKVKNRKTNKEIKSDINNSQ